MKNGCGVCQDQPIQFGPFEYVTVTGLNATPSPMRVRDVARSVRSIWTIGILPVLQRKPKHNDNERVDLECTSAQVDEIATSDPTVGIGRERIHGHVQRCVDVQGRNYRLLASRMNSCMKLQQSFSVRW